MSNTTCMNDTSDVARPPQSQKIELSETDSTIKRKYSNKENENSLLESLPRELLWMIFSDLNQVNHYSIELSSRHLRGVVRGLTWHLQLKNQTSNQVQKLYMTLTSDEHRSSMISSIRINSAHANGFTVNNRPCIFIDLLDIDGRDDYMRKLGEPRRVGIASYTSIDEWNRTFLNRATTTRSVEASLAGIIISAVRLRTLELITGHDVGDRTVLELLNSYVETMHRCKRIAFPELKIVHVQPLHPQNVDKEIIVYPNVTELRIVLPPRFNDNYERIVLRPSPGETTTLIKKLHLTGFIAAYRIVRDFLARGQAPFCEELEVKHRVLTSDDAPISDLIDALARNCTSLKKLSIGANYQYPVDIEVNPLSSNAFSRLAFSQLTSLALECDHVIDRSNHPSEYRRHVERIFAPFFMMLPGSVKHVRLGGLNAGDVVILVDDKKTQNPFPLCQEYCPELRSLRLTVGVWYSSIKGRKIGLEPLKAKMNDFALSAGMQLEVGWYIKNTFSDSSEEIHFAGAELDPLDTID